MASIMCVDDEIDTLDLLSLVLESAGFEVVKAFGGRECLQKLNERDIDLVLLDIMMPEMNGWDVYNEIKKMEKKPKIAFLSVMDVSTERKKKLLKEGVSDFIVKPFENSELLRRVKKII